VSAALLRIAAVVSFALVARSVREDPEAFASGGDPPRVVSMEPENLAEDLDAKKTTKLVVIFDRPMTDTSWSFCGGGPEFPRMKGKPHWDTPKKIVADVELDPDHEYHLSLNCPAAKNFRSGEGVPLTPVPWSFSTAPEKLPNQGKQKADNRKAFDALQKLLPGSYSYYDLRVRSWDKLFHEHESSILDAKTTRGWAGAVANMLSATEDIHMHLQLGDRTFAVGKRAIDPLFRKELVPHYMPVQPLGDGDLKGRTDDGIGYLTIRAWSDAKQVDAIESALPTLRECKAVIVDVRMNSGGDELLARRIAAWFVDGTKIYAKDRFRTGPGKDGFGPVQERPVTGNAEPEKRLPMPIAVLTSRYVMSSNESFVLMMRQAKDCTVVGQTTYGSSGNPKPFELPNGVTIVLPSWQDLRLDGSCFEGEGLRPDVEVAVNDKDLESKDPILERALDVVRQKIRN
jgi:hypothetical protein